MEFIARFGIPLKLDTDQGKNFESDLFKSVCNLFQINKTRTTAYHPSSNGLIERFNKTLGGMIKTFVNKNVTYWDEYINLLLAAYRSAPHPATVFSPNYMILDGEVNISEPYVQKMSDVIGTKVWQCRLCNFEHINKKGAVQHFMFRHTPNNQIPYLCNICNFKALTEGKWRNHANAMAGKPLREDSVVHTFQKSANPYYVKNVSDMFIKTTPLITPSTLKSEIKEKFEEEFIPDYDEEITISED
ncbi:unnamed protein product [Mytilus edulis]|uniref:Integrase catalytic domain-containing protein n=1 Tax=Mytilus edulis TaxID=6550 RepID=A0A8S3S943_MYTED|nr:unnamed protein product [Mytilus edulis]